ncbi:uncharacterized protein G2W53_006385 [Senna tora]|uniref:Uncharacterized protein n=1 Tax=Senna tora TaxID=362788 RepID=A0A834X448_9FABA|nr:uncharacterized protein G2W53_006385 [Senna tora]
MAHQTERSVFPHFWAWAQPRFDLICARSVDSGSEEFGKTLTALTNNTTPSLKHRQTLSRRLRFLSDQKLLIIIIERSLSSDSLVYH